jgi:hypothetical protein
LSSCFLDNEDDITARTDGRKVLTRPPFACERDEVDYSELDQGINVLTGAR